MSDQREICCNFRRDDLDAGDTAPYRAALTRPVVSSAEERDDLDAGDTASYRAALHRPVVESAEERDDIDAEDTAPYREGEADSVEIKCVHSGYSNQLIGNKGIQF